jgi:hypothetical protein
VLTEGAAQQDVVVPASADRTGRQLPRGDLGRTARAATSQLKEGPTVAEVPIDSQNGSRDGLNVENMIVLAAVLVGILKRSPSGGESEAAVPASQVSEVCHSAMMSRP